MTRTATSKAVIFGGALMAAVGIGFAVVRLVGSPDSVPAPSPGTAGLADFPVASAQRDAEAAADTPQETVQALASGQTALTSRVGEITDQVQTGMQSMADQVRELMGEIQGLRAEQAEREAREDEENASLRTEMYDAMEDMAGALEARIGTEYPVAGAPPEPNAGQIGADGLVWHSARGPEPAGGADDAGGIGAFPNPLAQSVSNLSIGGAGSSLLAPGSDEPPPPAPVYTIPPEATLVRSRGLTALIGRVPSQGQVSDPLPFKVITGPDNLLANGQVLPEIVRSIWTGTAIGDRTLHCVSGTLHQVTFIFADGSIRTWPEEGGGGAGGSLGWISDEQGYPCIPGRFVSNIEEIIGRLSASSFASGLAEAWAEQQVTTTVAGERITRAVTGDPGEFAVARGATRGINEWARVMAERARDTFDVVVVEPGKSLSIHVSTAIPIDWPREGGRRVRHLSSLSGGDAATRPGGLD